MKIRNESMKLAAPVWLLATAAIALPRLGLTASPADDPQTATPQTTPAQSTPAQTAPVQTGAGQAGPGQTGPGQTPDSAAQSSAKPLTPKGNPSAPQVGVTTSVKGSVKPTSPQLPSGRNLQNGHRSRRAMPAPPPPPPPWTLFKLSKTTTMLLDFTDANPDSIISLFARTSGITIVKDPSFKATITLSSAKAVHLDEAFEIFNTVLNLNGYELQKQGRLLVVGRKVAPAPPAPMPPPQPQPAPPPAAEEKPVLHVYKLENASASQVARVVNEVFSPEQLESLVRQLSNGGGFQPPPQQFGQPQAQSTPKIVRAAYEEYTNSVIVNATDKLQAQVADLIKQLDVVSTQPLDSKVFKLKFVAVSDVIDAIQDVLTANTPTGRGGKKSQDQPNNQMYFGGYNPFGNQDRSTSAGSQSAIAVKPTNSVIVTATTENLEVIKKLIAELDRETDTVGTTYVIHLENAKATDVAPLLMQAFTKPKNNQSENQFVVFDPYRGDDQSKKEDSVTDVDDNGHLVTVRDLTGKVNIIADPNTNSLIVVTAPSNIKLIKNVVSQIDAIAEQVVVEVVIVEANLDRSDKLGVEWNFTQKNILNNASTSATGVTDFGLQTASPLPQGFRYTLTGSNYTAFLNALQADNRFRILSTPRIFTSNNVQGKIFVGQTLQEQTSAQSGGLGGVVATYKDLKVGIGLTVTPRITQSGQVAMEIEQTADDLQGYSPQNQPVVNNRTTTTTATVLDGSTVILGGIISDNLTTAISKVPIIGDIPFLGRLFRSSSREDTQTELLVLLTPHIVKSNDDAQRIRRDQTKDLSPSSQDALRRLLAPKP